MDTSTFDVVKKDKAALFRKLGVFRVNSALKRIAMIGNLSNRSLYTYSDGDTKKLFDTLRASRRRQRTPIALSSEVGLGSCVGVIAVAAGAKLAGSYARQRDSRGSPGGWKALA